MLETDRYLSSRIAALVVSSTTRGLSRSLLDAVSPFAGNWHCSPAVVLVTLFLLSAQFSFGQQARLQTIRAGYNESISKLQSIHATYELDFEPAEGQTDLLEGTHLLDWAYDGRRTLYHLRPADPSDPSEHLGRIHFGSDGRQVWGVDWEASQAKLVRKYPVARANSERFLRDRGPAHFLGVIVGYGFGDSLSSSDSLQGLLARPETRFIGEEEVDAHPCWRVDIGPYVEVLGRTGQKRPKRLTLRVWFDPQAGFLPRQLVFHVEPVDTDDPPSRLGAKRIITRFRHLDEADAWFPETMISESSLARESFQLQAIDVGHRLPATVFQPQVPEGTRVIDFGDPEAAEAYKIEQMELADAEAELAAINTLPGKTVRAVPPSPAARWRNWLLGIAGAAFVLATLWIVIQRRTSLDTVKEDT